MDVLQQYTDKAVELTMVYAPKLLLAIITLLVGLRIIRVVVKTLNKAMEQANTDLSLRRFLASLVSILLKLLLVISVAAMVGIETTSFIAVLGAAGLAVGLALQGSLANFAGGILILLFKPYKVGDFIAAQGEMGTVHAIQVFSTILKTPDNKTIIVPNGSISNGNITNFSAEPTRRVDMTFGIGYTDNIPKAKEILHNIIKDDDRILDEPAPLVAVSELGDNSVNFAVRAWCNSGDYWGVFFDTQERVKLDFDANEISIPFPQRDVHVYNHQFS